ncbi:hypothetical protein Tco_0811808 [Tanacetum coccineum]
MTGTTLRRKGTQVCAQIYSPLRLLYKPKQPIIVKFTSTFGAIRRNPTNPILTPNEEKTKKAMVDSHPHRRGNFNGVAKGTSGTDTIRTALALSLAKGFSDRFSLESSNTSDTDRQTCSASKSQKTPFKNKESTHLRRSRRLEDRSMTKEKVRKEDPNPEEKGPDAKRQAQTSNMKKVQKMLIKT